MPNTPRDFIVQSNTSDSGAIASGGVISYIEYGNAVASSGSSISYSGGTFTADSGKYLIMWSDIVRSGEFSNSFRNQLQGIMEIGGVESIYCKSSGYLRKHASQGNSMISFHGSGIVDIDSDFTDIDFGIYRSDSVIGSAPTRVLSGSGVSILALDSSWDYGMYRAMSPTGFNSTQNTWNTIIWDNTDEENAPFTRTGGEINISGSNRYLISYTIPVELIGSANRTTVEARVQYDNVTIPGSIAYSYIRFSNGTVNGVLNWAGIVDIETSGNDLSVDIRYMEGVSGTIQYASASLQIMKLPSNVESIIVEANTGNMNANNVDFEWDTTQYIHPTSYAYTNGNSNIIPQLDGDYIFFSSLYSTQSGTRTTAATRFRVDGSNVMHASVASYGRNSGTADQIGHALSALLPGVSALDDIELQTFRLSPNGTSVINSSGQFSGFRIGSLSETVESPPEPTASNPGAIYFNSVAETAMTYINGIALGMVNSLNGVYLNDPIPTLASSIISKVYHLTGSMTNESKQESIAIGESIDLSNSVIISHHQFAGGFSTDMTLNYGHAGSVGYYFESDSSLVFRRGDYDGTETIDVSVQIVEFDPSVIDSIVTGSCIVSGSVLTASTLIESGGVLTDWTLIPAGNRSGDENSAANSYADTMGTYELVDVSGDIYVQIERGSAFSTGWSQIYYFQAVKFNAGILNSNPQYINSSISSSTIYETINAVDRDNSIMVPLGNSLDRLTEGHFYSNHYPKYEFSTSTSVEFNLSNPSSYSPNHAIMILEFTPSYVSNIQTGSISFGASDFTLNESIDVIDVDKSIILIGGIETIEVNESDKVSVRVLLEESNIQFTREVAFSGTHEVPYTVIEFN